MNPRELPRVQLVDDAHALDLLQHDSPLNLISNSRNRELKFLSEDQRSS